jgi:replication factor A1
MATINGIYEETRTDISLEEFTERVEQKSQKMGDVVGEESAALLVADKVGDESANKIADVTAGDDSVVVVGKITGMSEIKTFGPSGDSDESESGNNGGKVKNATIGDESDSIKTAFWNGMVETLAEEYTVGDTVRVEGDPREEYGNVQLSASNIEPEEDINISLDVGEADRIKDLTAKHEMATVKGRVIVTNPEHTFDHNGSTGRVSNFIIGDESGEINVAFWNKASEESQSFSVGDSIKIENANPKNGDEGLEIGVNSPNNVTEIGEEINYSPDSIEIDNVVEGERVVLEGELSSVEDISEFERDDGSEGVVQNVQLNDGTGRIRAALWGDKIIGDSPDFDRITLLNAEIQEGWQDTLEANVGYGAEVYTGPTVSDDEASPPEDQPTTADTGVEPSADPESTEEGTEQEDDEPAKMETPPGVTETDTEILAEGKSDPSTSNAGNTSEDTHQEQTASAPEAAEADVEVNGIVLKNGDETVIDTQAEKESIDPPENANLRLGQQITVRGERRDDGIIDATEIF